MHSEHFSGNVDDAALKLQEALRTHIEDPRAWRVAFTFDHSGLLTHKKIHTLLAQFDEVHDISMI